MARLVASGTYNSVHSCDKSTNRHRERRGGLVVGLDIGGLNNSAILGSREKAKSISDYSHGHEVSAQTSTAGGKFSSVKMWPP